MILPRVGSTITRRKPEALTLEPRDVGLIALSLQLCSRLEVAAMYKESFHRNMKVLCRTANSECVIP